MTILRIQNALCKLHISTKVKNKSKLTSTYSEILSIGADKKVIVKSKIIYKYAVEPEI